MKLFGKTLFCFICINLVLMPLMAEESISIIGSPNYEETENTETEKIEQTENEELKPVYKEDLKQLDNGDSSTTIEKPVPFKETKPVKEIKQTKNRKRIKQPNSPKGYRTPHVQDKCRYISELDEIHQVGLNIVKFLDIENFKALPRYFGGNKKADNKRNITIKAVQYFNGLGLSDPQEICNVSRKYFQDLAKKAYDNGKYLLAYNYLTNVVEGERFHNTDLDECKKHLAEKKKDYKHGDVFFFGKYEQDGNLNNGPEPIEWIVLRDTGEQLILLSKYVLAHKAFNDNDEMFIWEDSTLCSWLNKEFYNEAFNEEEKRRMSKIGADWYAEEYDGDYVVIPVLDDYSDLIDNFWLRAYAVPNDEIAQDLIDYEGNPFILSKDEKGKIKRYEYNGYLSGRQPTVLSSNEKIDKFSNFVYWPSSYWINQHNGLRYLRDGKCDQTYTFCDENGFFHTTDTKYRNGVRPVICVAYANIEKLNMSKNSSNSKQKKFIRRELDVIHQLGLNIFKFMDYPSFDNLSYGDKTVKRDIIKTAIKYFTDTGLSDPEEIYSVSKKYFQDLAEEKYKSGDYKQAYNYFTAIIEGEKFAQPKLLDCKEQIKKEKSRLVPGDIVFFGKYEQDGNLDNGQEPIEWIVLKKEDNKLILLSKYVLTHRPIHSVPEVFKWYESELCAWLNNEFYNEAFNIEEKKRMCKVGGNIWYLKEYKGDYVVIPGIEEFKGLEKDFLKAYAVPNDKTAKDNIYFDWKPFGIEKDDKGNIFYESDSGFDFYVDRKPSVVLSMNPNINRKSNLVYWPSGYWTSWRSGNCCGEGKNWEYYGFVDENGITWGNLDAETYNGVRPLIGITYHDGVD